MPPPGGKPMTIRTGRDGKLRLRHRAAREQRSRDRAEHECAPCRRNGQGIPPVPASAGVGAVVISRMVGLLVSSGQGRLRAQPGQGGQRDTDRPGTAREVHVYAGTGGHSAWFSDDGGETWVHPNSHSGMYLEARVWSIASHPGDARAAVRRHRHGRVPLG